MRLLGPRVAEVPLLATRPELQRNRLGFALLLLLEALVEQVCSSAFVAAAGGTAGAACAAGGAGAEGPLLVTPAFWGPGCPYIAYPPGQLGVPDVVPITQARWRGLFRVRVRVWSFFRFLL